MFTERPAAIPFSDARHDAFSVEACIQDVNRRFATFLAEGFDGMHEGGLPLEVIRLFGDLFVGVVSSDRRSRELAWLRHAFEERLAREPWPYAPPFAEAVDSIRDLLGDPFPAIGLVEAVERHSPAPFSVTIESVVPRLPLPPPVPHGLGGFTDPMRVAKGATEKASVAALTHRPPKLHPDAPTDRPPREPVTGDRPLLTPPPTWRPTRGSRFA